MEPEIKEQSDKVQSAEANEGTNFEHLNKWLAKQAETSPETPSLSVIVPAYNEERRLPPTLIDMIDYLDGRSLSYEIIVVDDGSSDGTSEVAGKFERIREQVRKIRLPKNYGKGHAVRTGALNARGDLILFADADGSTPFEELDRLFVAISHGADIAIGSRALQSEDTEVKTRWYRKLIGRTFNLLVNLFLISDVVDTQCGFKLFKREAARFVFGQQQSDGFSFDIELLFLARRVNLSVKEVPINWENVPGSKVNLLIDSAKMFLDIFRFAWIHRAVTPEDYSNDLEERRNRSDG